LISGRTKTGSTVLSEICKTAMISAPSRPDHAKTLSNAVDTTSNFP